MLAKLFTALISPLGTSLVLGVLALVLALLPCRGRQGARRTVLLGLTRQAAAGCRRRRLGAGLGVLALGWLWLWSLPVASDALRGWIEDQAGPRDLAAVPRAAVMVVLGGGVSGPRPPRRLEPDLNAAADRYWQAARLYRAGKAERLYLAGGETPGGDGSEAAAMRHVLLDLGVPATALRLEEVSLNTAGNARAIAELLAAEGVTEVVLVTSALHMPRARGQFEAAGLRVIPAPADFEVVEMPLDLLRLVPDAGALQGSARAFKELVGRWLGR